MAMINSKKIIFRLYPWWEHFMILCNMDSHKRNQNAVQLVIFPFNWTSSSSRAALYLYFIWADIPTTSLCVNGQSFSVQLIWTTREILQTLPVDWDNVEVKKCLNHSEFLFLFLFFCHSYLLEPSLVEITSLHEASVIIKVCICNNAIFLYPPNDWVIIKSELSKMKEESYILIER